MPAGKYVRTPEIRAAFKELMKPYLKQGLGIKKSAEHRAKLSASRMGMTPWNKGKKGAQVAWNKGKRQWQTAGEKNAAWKGGVTPIVMRVRRLFAMRLWRSDVFKRDDYTCQICGRRGGNLEAHHIKKFADVIQE